MNFKPVTETPVTLDLDSKSISYRLFTHPEPITSLEQAARERGQVPEQVIRSILFRIPKNTYILVLTAGPDQISWSALRSFLGTSRITMASKEQVFEQTGYIQGAVSPFGLSKLIRVLVDESVLRQEEISIGSGVRGTTVIMNIDEFKCALENWETGCFVECE